MKRKNDTRPAARWAFIVLILVFLSAIVGFGLFNQAQASFYAGETQTVLYDFYQGTASRQGSERATESAYLTVSAAVELTQAPLDNTAIAQFTQNPSLALSSTPYFVEILARDFLRRATTTPFASGDFGLPVMSSWVRSDESEAFIEILQAHGIEAMANFTSTGMEGINGTDLRGFQAFATTLYVGIDTDVFSDETLTPVVEKALLLLVEQEAKLDGIAFHRLDIWITFYDIDDETHSKGIKTTFHTFKEAQDMGLTGDALIKFLGGYNSSGE